MAVKKHVMPGTFSPRNTYRFHDMAVGEILKFTNTDRDPRAGARALCAAYAVARRSGTGKKALKFAGRTEKVRGKKVMHIYRTK